MYDIMAYILKNIVTDRGTQKVAAVLAGNITVQELQRVFDVVNTVFTLVLTIVSIIYVSYKLYKLLKGDNNNK